MKTQISINQAALYAMHHLAGVNDIRFYLNGVLIDVRADAILLVATDGTLLGAYKDDHYATDAKAPLRFIVPLDMVKRLKPAKNDKDVCVTFDHDTKVITMQTRSNLQVMGTAMDGVYPDYVRVIPTAASGEAGHFNPTMLSRFSKCAASMTKTVSGPTPIVSHNGEACALVTFGPQYNFVGAIMPLRMSNNPTPLTAPPAWIKPMEPSPAAKAFVDSLTTQAA